MKILLFCGFIFIPFNVIGSPQLRTYSMEIGDSCVLKDGTNGICELDANCQFLKDLLQNNKLSEIVNCGFKQRRQIVCCKKKSSEILKKCEEKVPLKPPRFDFHIVNGEEADVSEFPHMAGIGYEKEGSETEFEFNCGGSLITSRFVLTAAHCANRRGYLPKIVRLGKTSLNDNTDYESGQDIKIQKIILHENYSTMTKLNDIALLKLESDAKFAHNVWPICLSRKKQLNSGTNLTIIGFGVKDNDDKSKSDWLLKGTVQEYPLSKCKQYFQSNGGKPIKESQTCVSDTFKYSDTCQGDSGGPLEYIDNNVPYIYGVTSYGLGCGGQKPSVYTKVDQFISWIEEKIRT